MAEAISRVSSILYRGRWRNLIRVKVLNISPCNNPPRQAQTNLFELPTSGIALANAILKSKDRYLSTAKQRKA